MCGSPENGSPDDITPEMVEAGETIILEAVGGGDLGGMFSAADLARGVFEAMVAARRRALGLSTEFAQKI